MTVSDPFEAAARHLDATLGTRSLPPVVIVVGLGEGYLLDVLERRAPAVRVLALEPDRARARAFLARRDWSAWMADHRLRYLVDPDYEGIEEAWRSLADDPDDHLLIVDPAVSSHPGEAGVRAVRVLKNLLYSARANATARRRFAPRYLVNSLRNVPAIVAGRSLQDIAGVYAGRTAIIAAAGPSLDEAVPHLQRSSDGTVVVAVDTALRPLLVHGVQPTLVVGLDPGARNARHFQALPPLGDAWLVAESALDPSAVATFGERTLWFRAADHQPWPWLRTTGLDVPQVDVWGSVLTAAFQVAVLAGCDPIVLVGTDLAYTREQPYARGTTYEYDWAYSAALGDPIERAWRMQRPESGALQVPDVHGDPTITTAPLQAFRDWMVPHARRSGRRVINATGHGILYGDGIEIASAGKVLAGAVSPCPPLSGLGPRRTRATTDAVRGALTAALRGDTALQAAWARFSGPDFDPDAVRDALAEAVEALTPLDPRPKTSMHTVTLTGTLDHLAESVTRLKDVLEGRDGGPPHVIEEDVPARLAESIPALLNALDALTLHDSGAAGSCLPSIGRPIASGLARMPEPALWDLLRLEGWLGRMAPRPDPPADGYFTRDSTAAYCSLEAVAGPPGGPAATQLELEWLYCASVLAAAPAAHRTRVRALLRALSVDAATEAVSRAVPSECLAALVPAPHTDILARRGGCAPLDARRVTRPLTGVLYGSNGSSLRARLVRTRALTDAGLPPAHLAYGVDGGVVAVVPHQPRSILIRPDGTHATWQPWPRPIIGELSLEGGATVGWNLDLVSSSGYVLLRDRADAPVVEQALPFAPTFGAVWDGNVFWAGYPRGAWMWSPGGALVPLSDVSLRGVMATAEGPVAEPVDFDAQGQPRRLVATHTWHWDPHVGVRLRPAGREGASSARAAVGAWTAEAFPEADVVCLVATDGRRADLVCHAPFKVVWHGSSLVVSTLQAEVLWFDALLPALEAVTP